MKIDRQTLVRRLSAERDEDLVCRMRGYLSSDETRLVTDEVHKVTVSEALRLWSTRLGNTEITGAYLHGAAELVERLRGLTQQRKLEQFAFLRPEVTGVLFFENSTPHHFVGGVLVDAKKKRRAA